MSLTHAELGYWVCASFQHLKSFAQDAENIDEFEVTMLSGQTGVLLNAVRGRGRVSYADLQKIAKAQRIGQRRLDSNVLPSLLNLKSARISVLTGATGVTGLEEHIDSAMQFFEIVGQIWEMLDPTLMERGAVYVLQHTFVIPRMWTEELDLLVTDGFRDDAAESALGVTTSFRIVQKFETAKHNESVLFNPYVWRSNQGKIAAVITRMPDTERESVRQCVEETSHHQAFPADNLNVSRTLLETAHAIGLLDIVEVNTAAGDRKEFVFTPHLTTHPDVTRFADDLLNDVRAVLSCVSYGESFSRISRLGGFRREKTINFLQKLLRNGVAGDASAIGVDYSLLEERGIIAVEPTPTAPGGRYAMRLLRRDPLEIALKVIEDSVTHLTRQPLLVHTRTLEPASLFASPEQTRIRSAPSLGQQAEEVKEARDYFLKTIRKEVDPPPILWRGH